MERLGRSMERLGRGVEHLGRGNGRDPVARDGVARGANGPRGLSLPGDRAGRLGHVGCLGDWIPARLSVHSAQLLQYAMDVRKDKVEACLW